MKKLLSFALCLMLVLTAVPMTASAEPVTINVYNWGQYISDGTDGYIDVNKAFTEATGIKVNYMTFDSNETMYTKLKTGGSTYDVIIPSVPLLTRLSRAQPLALRQTPTAVSSSTKRPTRPPRMVSTLAATLSLALRLSSSRWVLVEKQPRRLWSVFLHNSSI